MEQEAAPDGEMRIGEWNGQDLRPRSTASDLAAATTIVAELLCERVGLRPGQSVLDVATGSGNGALAAARRGCRVCGIDRTPGLLERARERARAERLPAHFQLGDADAIPFPDASFDVVLSVFGVTVVANALQTAAELSRVCRPGGTIALASWSSDSVIGSIVRYAAEQAAHQPAGPTDWGTEHGVRSLFGDLVQTPAVTPRTTMFRCRSPEHFLEIMLEYYASALPCSPGSVDADDVAAVRAMTSVVQPFDRADDGAVIVPIEYLEVVAIRR